MIIINDLQLSTIFSDHNNKDTRCSSVNCALKGLAERLRSSQANPADVHKRVKFIVYDLKFIVMFLKVYK
jgi:hypothetical protein